MLLIAPDPWKAVCFSPYVSSFSADARLQDWLSEGMQCSELVSREQIAHFIGTFQSEVNDALSKKVTIS